LRAPLQRLLDVDGPADLAECLPQVLSVDVLEHEVRLGSVLADVEAALDAGVGEATSDLNFALVALEQRWVREQLRVRTLEHDGPTALAVACLVDLRVRALTERFEHLVAVDQVARLVTHQDEPRRKKLRFAAAAG